MSTQGIIDRALPWCTGWSRSSGRKNLLKVLEQGVDKLFSYDHDSMIYRGTDNKGFPPYLYTTSETYDYSLVAANLSCGAITRSIGGTDYTFIAKKVKKIFIDTSSVSPAYFDAWTGTPYRTSLNPYCSNQSRLFIADIRVSSQPAYENTPATVKFQSNPGAHTDKYFVEFYIGAPRLTAETIQIPVPYEFEVDLESYVIGFVKFRENGKYDDSLKHFEEIAIPKFQRYMGTAANTEDNHTPPRLC